MGKSRVVRQGPGIRRHLLVASLAAALMASGLVVAAAPGTAAPVLATAPGTAALVLATAPGKPKPKPKPKASVVDADTLTPRQLKDQIKKADALRAALMRSNAELAAANMRLERLSALANTLLANLSTARTAQNDADADAEAQEARLVELGVQVVAAQDSLGHLVSDSYIRGGGPLGDLVAIVEALTASSADQNTDSFATVQYLVDARARLFDRLESLRTEQVTTSARAQSAKDRATVAAKGAATAKSALDVVIAEQRTALEGFEAAEAAQVGRAAGLRGALLRSEDPLARAADRRLAEALAGQDFKLLMDESSSCGNDTRKYPNGRRPASALCPLYAAAGESLAREAALAFNAMSNAYQKHSGSAICVADSYRSYAEQVAIKLSRPGLAARPGTSQHGLGLALDLCGGVQSFANPAHLWMQRNAPLYGWFHPAWAEPSGVLPEPWHWEFAS